MARDDRKQKPKLTGARNLAEYINAKSGPAFSDSTRGESAAHALFARVRDRLTASAQGRAGRKLPAALLDVCATTSRLPASAARQANLDALERRRRYRRTGQQVGLFLARSTHSTRRLGSCGARHRGESGVRCVRSFGCKPRTDFAEIRTCAVAGPDGHRAPRIAEGTSLSPGVRRARCLGAEIDGVLDSWALCSMAPGAEEVLALLRYNIARAVLAAAFAGVLATLFATGADLSRSARRARGVLAAPSTVVHRARWLDRTASARTPGCTCGSGICYAGSVRSCTLVFFHQGSAAGHAFPAGNACKRRDRAVELVGSPRRSPIELLDLLVASRCASPLPRFCAGRARRALANRGYVRGPRDQLLCRAAADLPHSRGGPAPGPACAFSCVDARTAAGWSSPGFTPLIWRA